jgi:hypothetical protein
MGLSGYAPVMLPLISGAADALAETGYAVACAPIPSTEVMAISGRYVVVPVNIATATALEITTYAPTPDDGGGSFDTNWWWM